MFWRLALVVLLLLAAAPVRADDAADREEARREFTAGQAADRQRDWQTAIEHYLRANDLVPHPNAMFNIATDYERLGKLREAAVWYQRYIDAAQDSNDRERVSKQLRELLLRQGTLTVRSRPTGARVFVDNGFVGVTPYSGHIKGGAHRIAVEHEGRREEREVKIEFGEPATVDIAIRPGGSRNVPQDPRPIDPRTPRGGTAGTLRLDGQPAGALVTIDGRPMGVLPYTGPLAVGLHTVRVTQYGYAPYDTKIEVRADEETVLDAQLSRALGSPELTRAPIKIAYVFGAGGGFDAKGEGGLFLVEAGVRGGQYDATARIGKTAGLTVVDLLVRWTMTKSRIAPYVSAGYSFISTGDDRSSSSSSAGGYLLTGGLRFDVVRGEKFDMTLLAESGFRYYSGLDLSEAGEAPDSSSGTIVPIMTSLQLTYK